MKRVLCDENIPHGLRKHLPGHETVTAAYAGLAGYKNGALLKAAEDAGFDVLVTADKTLQYEQNMAGRKLALVCVTPSSSQIILPYVGRIVAAIDGAVPGSVTQVDCERFLRKGFKPKGPSLL